MIVLGTNDLDQFGVDLILDSLYRDSVQKTYYCNSVNNADNIKDIKFNHSDKFVLVLNTNILDEELSGISFKRIPKVKDSYALGLLELSNSSSVELKKIIDIIVAYINLDFNSELFKVGQMLNDLFWSEFLNDFNRTSLIPKINTLEGITLKLIKEDMVNLQEKINKEILEIKANDSIKRSSGFSIIFNNVHSDSAGINVGIQELQSSAKCAFVVGDYGIRVMSKGLNTEEIKEKYNAYGRPHSLLIPHGNIGYNDVIDRIQDIIKLIN